MNNKTRKITEGAMVVAFVGVIVLINRLLGGTLITTIGFIMPFPLLIYSAKYGIKDSIVVFFAMFFITYLFSDLNTIIFSVLYFGLGLSYGSMTYANYSNKLKLTVSIVVSLLAQVVIILSSTFIFGFSLIDEAHLLLKEFSALINMSNASLLNIILVAVSLSYIFLGVIEAVLVHLVSALILPRLNILVAPLKFKGFKRISSKFGYLSLAFLSLNFLELFMANDSTLMQFIYILSIIVLLGYSIYGLLVFSFIIKFYKLGYLNLVLIILVLIIPFYLIFFLGMLGIVDVCLNLRYLVVKRRQNVK
ncbi:MAG: DUF2232 domain-containing protein [Erysipelotrichaceae bacterium]